MRTLYAEPKLLDKTVMHIFVKIYFTLRKLYCKRTAAGFKILGLNLKTIRNLEKSNVSVEMIIST